MRGARILVLLVGGVLGALWLARGGPERVGRARVAGESLEREVPPSPSPPAPPAPLVAQNEGSEREASEVAATSLENAFENAVPEFSTSRALVWFGRIVDGASGTPLAGAEVVRVVGDDPDSGGSAGSALFSDAQGSVELSFPSGTPSHARIALDGYATVFAPLDEGHGELARARRVPLSRDAHLQVLVRGADGAAASGLTTSIEIPPWYALPGELRAESMRWTRLTDDSGLCVFERLPSSVLLKVSVLEGDRRLLSTDQLLQLEPGQSTVLSLTVGGACTIDGLVLEPDGSAAPDVDVWLIPRGGNAYLDWRQEQDVVARARSDARGRFTLPDVTAGTWRVGIAPEMPRARMPRTDVSRADGTPLVETPESYDLSPPDATRSPAPIASEIVLTAEQTHAEVTLTCWRGLYIRGRVIGMGSELVDGAFVTAKGGRLVTTVQSRLLGFSLGPLPPGSYQVGALRTVKPYGEAQPVTADAGTEDVVLQLVPQGPLWIAVLDSQGSPAGGAQVWFFPEGGANDWRTSTAPEDGRVGMLSGLGRLTIAASTAAGEYGWTSGVEVGRDGPAELELHLHPAARLRVVVPAALVGHVLARVRQDGRVVGLLLVDGRSVVVPAGELEVELFQSRSDSREAPERRSVHMVEGLETVVEFTAVTSAK